jgi:hypothetical protein
VFWSGRRRIHTHSNTLEHTGAHWIHMRRGHTHTRAHTHPTHTPPLSHHILAQPVSPENGVAESQKRRVRGVGGFEDGGGSTGGGGGAEGACGGGAEGACGGGAEGAWSDEQHCDGEWGGDGGGGGGSEGGRDGKVRGWLSRTKGWFKQVLLGIRGTTLPSPALQDVLKSPPTHTHTHTRLNSGFT